MTPKILARNQNPSKIDQLVDTIARLRGEQGCPWDKEQTHKTLAPYLLEEVYEVLESIHIGDVDKLQEELGDLLLQVVMHSQIASESKTFDLDSVASAINDKMIRRHPHVFGDADAKTAHAVVAQWEQLKEQERTDGSKGNDKSQTDGSALDGIPNVMPALLKALKISQRAVAQGFDWTSEDGIWEQLASELKELKEAVAHYEAHQKQKSESKQSNPKVASNDESAALLQALKLELGDVLFTIVNLARWHKLDPEEALLLSSEKFKKRFQSMEKISSRPLKDLTIDELEELWRTVKRTPM